MINRDLVLVLMAIAFTSPEQVHATSFAPQTLPEAVQETQYIVRGKIVASETRWQTTEGGRTIITNYELSMGETLKGQPPTKTGINIRTLGGAIDGIVQSSEGTAVFHKDEEVVVFLGEMASDGSVPVQGMEMGKYTLREEDGVLKIYGGRLAESPIPYADFKVQVEQALENGNANPSRLASSPGSPAANNEDSSRHTSPGTDTGSDVLGPAAHSNPASPTANESKGMSPWLFVAALIIIALYGLLKFGRRR